MGAGSVGAAHPISGPRMPSWGAPHALVPRPRGLPHHGRRRRRRHRRLPRRAHPQPRGDHQRDRLPPESRHRSPSTSTSGRPSTTRPATRSACSAARTARASPLDQVPQVVIDAVVATEDKTFWDNDGRRPLGRRPRRAQEPHLGRDRAGRIDDLAAAREEPDPLVQARPQPQDPRGLPGDPAQQGLLEARDPRAVPQHRVLRAELLRHQGRGRAPPHQADAHRAPWPRSSPRSRPARRRCSRASSRARPRTTSGCTPTRRPGGARSSSTRWWRRATSRPSRATSPSSSRSTSSSRPTTSARATRGSRRSRTGSSSDQRYAVLGDTPEAREAAILKGGLKIYATLDPGAQANAQGAIDETLPEKPGFTASLVAIEPHHRRGEGDGRRTRVRGESVQHRDEHAGSPGGVHLEGHHARGGDAEPLLGERHGQRHRAVRLRPRSA